MNLPGSVLFLTPSPESAAPAIDALVKRGIAARGITGNYRFIAAFASEHPETVVIDIEGWRRQDMEMLQVLREMRPETGIIAVVGPEQRDLTAQILSAGADLYLLRPLSAEELAEALERSTRRRRMEKAVAGGTRHAEALSQFAIGVAAELNNPLATISGWLQMLADDRASDPQMSGVLRSMKDEADRIANVARQLLVFAQQRPPRIERVEVGRLLDELARVYRANYRNLNITVEKPEPVPAVAGDEYQLRQACDALLHEAAVAMNGGGRIAIACRPARGGVEIDFHDNGPAIPAQALQCIFDPFHPGRRDGQGMGLAVTHGIIHSHGGLIDARSADGEGTRFTLWLPVMQ